MTKDLISSFRVSVEKFTNIEEDLIVNHFYLDPFSILIVQNSTSLLLVLSHLEIRKLFSPQIQAYFSASESQSELFKLYLNSSSKNYLFRCFAPDT